MKEEGLKEFLQDKMVEKAPDSFTLNVMEKVHLEVEAKSIREAYTIPGKGILIFLFLFFFSALLWAFIGDSSSNLDLNGFYKYFQFEVPEIGFKNILSSTILMYISLAIPILLAFDYFIKRPSSVRVIS